MRYRDRLYGEYELPDFIGELAATSEIQRLKDVSQDVLPQSFIKWNVPSRFEHSMGVVKLGMEVLNNNPGIASVGDLLLVSALLHDAGNPPLSHLAEPFLKQFNGKDGESFLEEMLENSEASKIIRKIGLVPRSVVGMVTGNYQPFSEVLNGSIDIDNLDNVGRYWFVMHGQMLFSGQYIASQFRFLGGQWLLIDEPSRKYKRWQSAREMVYRVIYGEPHLNICMMIYHAVAIAFEKGELSEEFFRMSDTKAVQFRCDCNEQTAHLMRLAIAGEIYPQIIGIETTMPSDNLRVLAKQWDARQNTARYIAESLGVPRESVCVYVGKGRDKRKIDLPFVSDSGAYRSDEGDYMPIYRFKVYVDPTLKPRAEEIKRIVEIIEW